MNDIVGPHQHIDRTAETAVLAHSGRKLAEFNFNSIRRQHLPGDEHAFPVKIGDEAIGRVVIQAVPAVPLLNYALMQDTDFAGNCKCFMLVLRYQDCGRILLFQDSSDFEAVVVELLF